MCVCPPREGTNLLGLVVCGTFFWCVCLFVWVGLERCEPGPKILQIVGATVCTRDGVNPIAILILTAFGVSVVFAIVEISKAGLCLYRVTPRSSGDWN